MSIRSTGKRLSIAAGLYRPARWLARHLLPSSPPGRLRANLTRPGNRTRETGLMAPTKHRAVFSEHVVCRVGARGGRLLPERNEATDALR